MKITVVGMGYVGLSLSVLLAQSHKVTALEINPKVLELLNSRISPIKDKYISTLLKGDTLSIQFMNSVNADSSVYANADYIIIAIPTNYDADKNTFNIDGLNDIIKTAVNSGTKAGIIIKSTIPVGYTQIAREYFNYEHIYFSPEFLREGKAFYDNQHPSRIIVGGSDKKAMVFANMLKDLSLDENVPVLFMSNSEAEAVKLFSNTYLAVRVSFFNELDTYSETMGLNTLNIINGVCLDPRIGNHYNNPSFGYGGYCLTKDTKQLVASYGDIPNEIIKASVASNATRMNYIANTIIKKNKSPVGIYRLIMKSDSDNFREAAIMNVIRLLKQNNIQMLIYEPLLQQNDWEGVPVIHNFEDFKNISQLILCNRSAPELDEVKDKLYTRDIFSKD